MAWDNECKDQFHNLAEDISEGKGSKNDFEEWSEKKDLNLKR